MLKYNLINNGKDDWVVFVHGIAGSTLTWKKQLDDFSKQYNILLLDLPGHGANADKRIEHINTDKLNNGIKETLDRLGIKKAYFVAMSIGTLVAAGFAIAYPKYVKAMVFGGAVLATVGVYKFCVYAANIFKRVFPYELMYQFFAWFMMPKKNHMKSREIFLREAVKLKRETLFAWIEYLTQCTHPKETLKKFAALHIKTLFISGDEDRCFLKGVQKTLKQVRADMVLLPHCGHVCSIERYKDFNRYAIEYLLAA